MQEQQRIAQEQARLAREQAEQEARRQQEEAERAKTAANPNAAPAPSAPQYDNNGRSYYPDFNGNSAHDPNDYEDYAYNLEEYINNTTPDASGYIPLTDPNIPKLREDYTNLQNKENEIEDTDAYRWQNPRDMAKMNDLQNDAIDFNADVHKTGLKYVPQNEIDQTKQFIRDGVDADSNEHPNQKGAINAVGKHIERKMLDPEYARNENKQLLNDEYGRSLSDYYTNQAKEDRELGDSLTSSPRSAAGIPSNLKAGTANGSYQANTFIDENTGDINEVDPRNALNKNDDVVTADFAHAKKPEFMTDGELNFYEQKILNAPNQSETAKILLSSIQQEKARRKQAVDNERNELRMPSDARAGMNGEPRPTVDARPLTDPNANNNAKMIGKTAAGAGLIALAGIAAKFLTGTIFNKVTSIGKFTSGNQMLASPAFNQKLQLIARKFPGPYPTVQDVKASPNARNKDTFMGWLLGGNVASKHLDAASTGTLIKNTQLGIPVAITTISST